ncbi:MAG: hypothetical protein JXR10_13815 [Cyclobacteriaceae bacterium]
MKIIIQMKRIHLFEFEGQKWFPSFLRNYGTDFLQFLSSKTKMYKPIIPIIEKGLKRRKIDQIIDLGSGAGSGLLWLSSELKKEIPNLKNVLIDSYGNISAFKFTNEKVSNSERIETSADARDVPNRLSGLRTQFLSLHHFKPHDAKCTPQNNINTGSHIDIFEGQERSYSSILAMLFSPISVLLTTPIISLLNWDESY